ncbi:radical SAM family heme chaperone HemW [Thermotalea metallivorans]|uniref:Heme chaperone HemW n=1 Tax=Thermotalea metallivorans TaxID=520762 RepID=A0A140L5N2_9FIRM|nr:radical SAM family heme chaperone HemW [Thermotalea metallivorans]KXG75857.1 Oxygen-independent coproporphyrinogen-III oxidase-like protein YqeR [Thermotalea metallivorans]
MKELGIYIHIPFCAKKCSYCDFTSFGDAEEKIPVYADALVKEITSWKDQLADYKVRSIFIGGGTPTIVPVKEMDRVMESLYQCFSIEEGIEFSIESNPGTIDKEKLQYYLASHINRISMGLQAWQDTLLKSLGRIHDRAQFVQNYGLAREMGFQNINVDLMFGLPGQNISQWKETLGAVAALKPDHISAYSLKIEEGTLFDVLYEKGKLYLPSEEEDRKMYEDAIEFLQGYGYRHYEISNFARAGKECVHNKIYWNNGEYIGIGLGAHSYWNRRRFANTTEFEEYIEKVKSNQNPTAHVGYITIEEEIAETMFLGLRMMEGISIPAFIRRFGVSPTDIYQKTIEKFVEQGLLEVDQNHIRLTRRGIDVSNQVFTEFLPN